jgi:chromosome segregation protein
MFLSKLQILGFKSFPQKTELHFDQGITAIVGPNGCGKTNILDSIRWVLGEQRITLLRSSKMEEVIFSGTKDMKPLGMAEVSLVVNNSQGLLPIDYNQVTVTRRLFRSGESEYLLNKTPCRLKDITELFLDTGVGIHAYSVIQPEMVEAILSEKAEERRFMFEEAAGITKYKLRKKEAERKLEHTENDLLRLGDILAEVEKQTNSLKRQKGKAERYKRLTEEIRELEIGLSQNEFLILKGKERELQEKLKASADQVQKAGSDLDKQEAEAEELKLKHLETEKESATRQREISEFTENSFRMEREISVNRERKNHLEKLIEKNQHELENLKTRLSAEMEGKEEKAKNLNQLAEEIRGKKGNCEAQEQVLLANDEKLQQLKTRLEKLSSDLQDVNGNLTKLRSEKENTLSQIEEVKRQESSLSSEMQSLKQKDEEVSEKLNRLSLEVKEGKGSLEEKAEQKRLLTQEFEQNRKVLADLGTEENKVRTLLEGEKARLDMLRQISEHYEGYDKGEKSVLSAKESLLGIIDTVANLVNAKEEHIKAIESALGGALQFIVCEDTDSAINAIHYLRSQNAGRATFLPLDKVNVAETDSSSIDLSKHPEAIGWAAELVQCQSEFRKMLNLLLAKVILVRHLDEALTLSSRIGPGYHIATLEGEIMGTEGTLSGGSPKEIFLLGRELGLKKLEDQISQLDAKLDQFETEKREKGEQLENQQEDLVRIATQVEEITTRIRQSEIELRTLEFEKASVDKQRNQLDGVDQRTKDKLAELKRRDETISSNLEQLDDRRSELSSLLEKEKLLLEETEAYHTETFRTANQLKIELVSLQGKEEQIRNEQDRIEELISEIRNAHVTKEKECEDSSAEIGEIDETNSQKEKELKEIFDRIEEVKAKLNWCIQSQTRLQEELNAKEKNLKASRGDRERVQDLLHQIDMEKVELSSRASNIRNRISEEYQVDLKSLEAQAALETEELKSLKEKLATLKDKLNSMGAVNLLALEEYQSTKQRLDFLQSQVKDLTEAKQTLTSTIAKINDTAKTLFTQTFEQIKLNFQKVFEDLFEGGETDLRLLDETDPLESPVQISARPYGKRLLNISQLSGGEKALTAIALLFAIYLVKASPFCILDEVDAPLDDPNTTKFLKLIKHFSSTTQFILITHNKLTMEAADILYGVTMEQPGVSKIVSVKFEEHEVATK